MKYIKATPLLVQKLWYKLKFLERQFKGHKVIALTSCFIGVPITVPFSVHPPTNNFFQPFGPDLGAKCLDDFETIYK